MEGDGEVDASRGGGMGAQADTATDEVLTPGYASTRSGLEFTHSG
jgi:hypothetical protein